MAAHNENSEPVVQEGDNKISNNSGDNQHRANDDTKDTDHQKSLGDDSAAGATGLFGYSKLHVAASNGQAGALKLLLAEDPNSADVNGKTVDGGYTPLHLAASAGHADCVEELLQCHKTDIHMTDTFGRTPLETAEQNFKNEVAKLLRTHGKNLQYYLVNWTFGVTLTDYIIIIIISAPSERI